MRISGIASLRRASLRGLCCVLLLTVAALTATAFAEEEAMFVFPYEGFRFEAPPGALTLTQHNLGEHAEVLEALGTDATALLAYMRGNGVVLTVYPAIGGQVELSVAPAPELVDAGIKNMDERARQALLSAYEGMPRYQEVAFSQERPDWLRMVFSTQQAGMPVYTLRYVTLAHGQQYMFSSVLIGRAPEPQDDTRALEMIGRIEFLSTRATPEPTATPVPTPMPTATPAPTPGVAELVAEEAGQGAALTVAPPPAWVGEPALTITGTASPGAAIRLLLGDEQLDRVTANREGGFELECKLPEPGNHALTITAALEEELPASVTYSVLYELPKLFITVTAPTEPVTRREEAIRGITLPNAKVEVRGGDLVASVRANAKGEFSIRLRLEKEGEVVYTLTAMLKGYESAQTTHAVTRVFSYQEGLNAFRISLINIDYKKLVADPTLYEGKNVGYRGRIASIGDMDGVPCMLFETKSLGGGEWGEPVWLLCETLPPYAVGDVFTAYSQGTGRSASYTDAQGNIMNLPVVRMHYFK